MTARLLREACAGLEADDLVLSVNPSFGRKRFEQLLQAFNLQRRGFTLYSLRRGGAAAHFHRFQSMEFTLQQGRWSSARTARLYLSQTVADSVAVAFSAKQLALIDEAASWWL